MPCVGWAWCDLIGNIIGNVIILNTWVAMGGHRSMLMGVVCIWVQIPRKCWAFIVGYKFVSLVMPGREGQ